jgi:soluble lytic murein transglycosylase
MTKLIRYCLVAWLSILNLAWMDSFAFDTQREAFKAAEQAAGLENRILFNTLKVALRDYPLYPYLLYRDLTRHLPEASSGEVRDFLQRYQDSPLAGQLRPQWIKQLAQQQRWSDILQDYQAGADTATECLYDQALLNTGRENEALNNVEALWLVGTSQPDVCDPLFEQWRAKGGITRERIWQRFTLAMNAGQTGLGRYLNHLLPEPDKAIAELWIAVYEKPQRVLEADRFNLGNPYTPAILLDGVWQWSKRDSVAAAQALDQLQQRYHLPPSEKLNQLERRLAILIAKRGHPSAAVRLSTLPQEVVDQEVEEWRVRMALQRSDWALVLQWIDTMRAETRNALGWLYWRARALEVLGNGNAARTIYQSLAQNRDYYGFLAADRLGLPYQIEHHPIQVSEKTVETLARLPGFLRAHELYLLDRPVEARAEWSFVSQDFTPEQLITAAKLAQSWDWYGMAIATLARADVWDDLELRFPLPHRQAIDNYARSHNLDPAWVYAVMRQESLFQPDARSAAGALGLMQIMPGTGRKIAADLNLHLPGSYALFNVDTNIQYGTYYLRYTLNQLQGNPVLATAAYNAGPNRIQDWLPQQTMLDADIWAELIPFDETRNYVRRVMEYAAVYEWRLGRPQSSMRNRMVRVLPGA